MKIAYIVDAFYPPSETFVRDLVMGLAHKGMEVTVVCHTTSHEGEQLKGVALHKEEVAFPLSLFQGLVWKILRRVAVSARRSLACRAWAEGALATVNLKKTLRQVAPDVVYVDFGHNAVKAVRAVRELGLPMVVHYHGFDASKAFGSPLYAYQTQEVFAVAQALVVPSEHLRRLLVIAGAEARKIFVIAYGPNLTQCSAPNWEEKLKGAPTVLSLGRLVAKKNPLALVEAFALVHAALPESRLIMVGGGPLLESVTARIAARGISEVVTLTGVLPQAQALAKMSSAWVFAQHSVTDVEGDQEGLPVAIMEASACGLPVVSTVHSGIPEEIEDGVTGFLVREHDFEEMASRILELLRNPQQARKMGEAGRERALGENLQQVRFDKIYKLLQAVGTPADHPKHGVAD